MKVTNIVFVGIFICSPSFTNGILEGLDSEELPSMEKLKSYLEMPVLDEAKPYIKQITPFLTLIQQKVHGEDCKDEVSTLASDLNMIADDSSDHTFGDIAEALCTFTEECFPKFVKSITTFVSGNPMLKSGADNFLNQYGIKLETIDSVAPLMFKTGCDTFEKLLGLEDDDEADSESEKVEL